ncbi:putative bifunctional diguanylate cyclase/phosphodiesterase [Pseudidiomarina mangrovi]|uniref:putative bifunctional diguanylate cyclase/phosphodiesterase n=1 Tax=Pseudidiomarina mangrovi TaxID=2487133 RepID=UPI000FCB3EBA|nr:bifunctional diguanylate cyclase/phosphodiesterase [Pseudidiomarina mangrovi]
MAFIKTDLQGRSVLHLVTALSLLASGSMVLAYRLFEPTQLLLFHSVSSSYLVIMIGLGVAMLWRNQGGRRTIAASFAALIAFVAAIDGLGFNVFDPFDSQIHPVPYVLLGVAALTLIRPPSQPHHRSSTDVKFIQGCATYGLLIALAGLLLLIPHLIFQQPFLARHPMGSLIICASLMLAGTALYATHHSGRRPMPKLARSSFTFTLVVLYSVLSAGIVMFHNEMESIRLQGVQAVEGLNSARKATGSANIDLFRRLATRWESYSPADHDRLMDLDMRDFLEQVDFLDSFILLAPNRQVRWERVKPNEKPSAYLLTSDPAIAAELAANPYPAGVQLMVVSPQLVFPRSKLLVRLSVKFADDEPGRPSSFVAVLDVQRMLAVANSGVYSPIFTYTKVGDERLLDQHGFWVTPENQLYLQESALFLHGGQLSTDYSSGTPIYSYLYDLRDMQGTANLQVLIVLAGMGLVLLVVLAVERNATLEDQGARLKYQAEHDALTGLLNRNSIERFIAKRFNEQGDMAVLFIDLDGFTLINDSLGLQVGDELLRMLAQRLQNNRPRNTELARFASDEFLLVMQGVSGHAERVLQSANDMMSIVAQPYRIGPHKIYLTASIGVAMQTDDQRTPLELIQRADMAMHQAKKLGHNHVQEYDRSMAQRMQSMVSMRSSLQEAIEHDRLQLYYQPIVNCANQQVEAYEALLRWVHEDGKVVSPGEFIPLAEMTGQIVPLSEWVFRQACHDLAQIREKGSFKITVNVSALHFHRANFVEFLEETLANSGVKAEWIELEMTESILLENSYYAIRQLQRLRELGFTVALDDFGTGFSSLSYLKRLPVDKVKIDRTFVAGIRTHKSDRVLIESVIKIAQSLNFNVVAEGVETPQQAEFVTELGCNYMQGFYFARPAPIDEL